MPTVLLLALACSTPEPVRAPAADADPVAPFAARWVVLTRKGDAEVVVVGCPGPTETFDISPGPNPHVEHQYDCGMSWGFDAAHVRPEAGGIALSGEGFDGELRVTWEDEKRGRARFSDPTREWVAVQALRMGEYREWSQAGGE